MISNEKIIEIIGRSTNAPSGSNSQPWRFEIKDSTLIIIGLPEKDHPILNYRNRGTWLAHGALIENIKINANASGYQVKITPFPNDNDQTITAHLTFEEDTAHDEGLAGVIPQRMTNRYPFEKTFLTDQQTTFIAQSSRELEEFSGELFLEENSSKITVLANAVAANEIITLETKELHHLFFNELVCSRKEEEKRKMGLYIKTMGLQLPQEMALKLFRHWFIMRLLNKVGIAKKIASSNAKGYSATPIMGAILVPDTDKDFLIAGQLIERIWLKATQLGFGFHLMTGTLFFWQGMINKTDFLFTTGHQELIKSEYENITSIFKPNGKIVAALFRLGKIKKVTVP